MKGILGKIETVGYEVEELIEGKLIKTKRRMLKLPVYVEIPEFPDALSYDSSEIHIYRPNDNMVKETDPFKSEVLQRIDNITSGFLALSKLINEKEK